MSIQEKIAARQADLYAQVDMLARRAELVAQPTDAELSHQVERAGVLRGWLQACAWVEGLLETEGSSDEA